jgi:ribonuclease HI
LHNGQWKSASMMLNSSLDGRSSLKHSWTSLWSGPIQVYEELMSYLIIGWCILMDLGGDILKYAIQLEFSATNNIAEYEGLITGLRLAKDLGIRWLLIRGDSQLVAKQVQKEYDCNNEKMVEYLAEVRRMEKFFNGFEVWYVPHLDNRDADHLGWIASSRAPTSPDVIIEKLYKASVKSAK